MVASVTSLTPEGTHTRVPFAIVDLDGGAG